MAPWVSAGLFSPVALGTLIFVIFISLLILRAISKRTFQAIGWMRLMSGYLGAAAALAPLGLVLGDFSLAQSFEAWLGLSFAGWLALALLVVPAIFVLIAHNLGSVIMSILVGTLSALPIQMVLFWLSGPMGREALSSARLVDDTMRFALFLSMASLGFALGARLPLRISSRSQK